ncbi:MAG: helix-turn-helix transcriptional regulator [Rhizobiaceae bacterium]|nr:helix-turn-helix transcriptional regulator [Rhizobiaceae bacterium]
MGLAESVGADAYLLLTVTYIHGRGEARVIASDWSFDAIDLAGRALLARLASASFAAAPGSKATSLVCAHAPSSESVSGEEARFLDASGHGEIFALKLHAGRRRLFLLLSSETPGSIEPERLGRAQMECCYMLSEADAVLATAVPDIALADRERECLLWVCEGKTTDEVAVILGVSANTVNNYITAAIHKLSASNRAMAIATAIRGGII